MRHHRAAQTHWRRRLPVLMTTLVFAEIVLTELLSAFMFEDSGKPVLWNISEVVYPTVGQDSSTPAFPMKVTAL